jgi:hypothetical protein
VSLGSSPLSYQNGVRASDTEILGHLAVERAEELLWRNLSSAPLEWTVEQTGLMSVAPSIRIANELRRRALLPEMKEVCAVKSRKPKAFAEWRSKVDALCEVVGLDEHDSH